MRRLVGHDAYRAAVQASKPNHHVLGEVGHDFKEILVVEDRFDDVFDVVRERRLFGDDRLERFLLAGRIVGSRLAGRIFHVVRGKEAEQFADGHERLLFVVAHEMRDAALRTVRIGAAQFLFANLFVRHGLDHIRPGNEHVALLLHHKDKVRKGWRIASATCARAQDGGDLRNHARRNRILVENRSIAGQTGNALLDTRATRIVQGNDGRPVLQGQLLHLDDLLRIGFAQRASERRKVVSVDKDQAAVDFPITAHDAVAHNALLLHTEVVATVGHQFIQFVERPLVEQHVDAFACCHAALLVELLDFIHTAALLGFFVDFFQFFVYFFSFHCFILV